MLLSEEQDERSIVTGEIPSFPQELRGRGSWHHFTTSPASPSPRHKHRAVQQGQGALWGWDGRTVPCRALAVPCSSLSWGPVLTK